jgi:hypothetical protein
MKVDVAVQSFNKPESLIYTLFSLKKYSGQHIDKIYIDDDLSERGVVEAYTQKKVVDYMYPIKLLVRTNTQKIGYAWSCNTKSNFRKKNFIEKIQILMQVPFNRAKFYKNEDDIRYQWCINNTDKKYIFVMHDDIKFNGDIVGLYLETFKNNDNVAIVGDLGGSPRCEFGPCGTKECNPQKIMEGYRPYKYWPITGKPKTFLHKVLGRKSRHCRINEWCCMLDVDKAKVIKEKYGACFGNVEGGGDTAVYWFEKIVNYGYEFIDPLPNSILRLRYYLHCWQGHSGHSVWVKQDGHEKTFYDKEMIRKRIETEFNVSI